jgi:hypothetical protein
MTRTYSFSRVLPVLAAGVLLGACAPGTESGWTPPAPPPSDPAVRAVLPSGSYLVEGALTLNNGPVTSVSGYVSFGAAGNGRECVSDVLLRDQTGDAVVSAVREVRSSGAATAYGVAEPVGEEPSVWKTIDDPSVPALQLMFVPALVNSDLSSGMETGWGHGNMCSIPMMDRFMRLDASAAPADAKEGSTLVFDVERTTAAIAATRGRWVRDFLAAVEPASLRDRMSRELSEMTTPSMTLLTKDTVIVITPTEDGFTVVQFRDGRAVVELRLTATTERPVQVVSAPDYFTNVADAIRSGDASTLDAVLEMASQP